MVSASNGKDTAELGAAWRSRQRELPASSRVLMEAPEVLSQTRQSEETEESARSEGLRGGRARAAERANENVFAGCPCSLSRVPLCLRARLPYSRPGRRRLPLILEALSVLRAPGRVR